MYHRYLHEQRMWSMSHFFAVLEGGGVIRITIVQCHSVRRRSTVTGTGCLLATCTLYLAIYCTTIFSHTCVRCQCSPVHQIILLGSRLHTSRSIRQKRSIFFILMIT